MPQAQNGWGMRKDMGSIQKIASSDDQLSAEAYRSPS